MQKAPSRIERPQPSVRGFALVEMLVAIGVFLVFATAVATTVSGTDRRIRNVADAKRAAALADEALEAARNIRDAGYANLVNGTFGLAATGNRWELAGTSDVTGKFTRRVAIADGAANAKHVTATVTWPRIGLPAGTFSATTRLTDWRAVTAPRGGMLAYADGDGTSDLIRYRTYRSSDGTWSATATAADVDAATSNRVARVIRLYASGTRDEQIMLSRHYNGTTQYIYGQVYNGTAWGNVQLLASWNASTFLDVQNFDGTYLNNGDFMAVFSNNTTTPQMRVWNGSGWSAQTATQPLGGIPNYIVAKARPGTNEVMFVDFDQQSDTNSQYYNGAGYATGSWTVVTSHANNAPTNTKRFVDFAWSSGDPTKGVLVYAKTNVDKAITARLWTADGAGGGSWAAPINGPSKANILGSLKISARPSSSEFQACEKDGAAAPAVTCQVISYVGTTASFVTPSANVIATVTDAGIQRSFDVAYEYASGATAVAIYSDGTASPKLKKYDAATNAWAASATAVPTGTYAPGTVKTTRAAPSPVSDDIMLLVADANNDLYSVIWNGTTDALYATPAGKAFLAHGLLGTSTTGSWYDFAWNGR